MNNILRGGDCVCGLQIIIHGGVGEGKSDKGI